MSINRDYADLLKCLNRARVKYVIVGAYAVIYHTEPRYTKDLDILVRPDAHNAKRVYSALSAFGAPLDDIAVEDFSNPDLTYQLGIEPNRIDIIMQIDDVDFDRAWESRRRALYGDQAASFLGLEMLIKNKRAVGRPQDLLDLEKLLKAPRKSRKR